MKKITLMIAILLLSILAFGLENKSLDLDFSQKFKLKKTNVQHKGELIDKIFYANNGLIVTSGNTGEPNIPWISVNVSVPNGASFVSVNLIKNNTFVHENTILEAVQKIIPTSYTGNVDYVYPNYENQNIYPSENVKFSGVSKLSTYTIFNFQVSPFEYDQKTNTLIEIQDFTLELEYELGKEFSNVKKWDNGDFYEIVKEIVVNKNDIPLPIKRIRTKDVVDHLIITNNALSSSFQSLATHRTANGLASEVITTETIYSTYSGATNQLKIKNCIKDYYENNSTMWIVIGGDDTIVPDQNTYGAVNGTDYEDYTIPTDLFYACFDDQFDWNATNDDKVGDTNDNVDMAPEVFIGRIPVRTSDHVAAYVNKMIDYELNPPSDIATKFLMTGCELWGSVGSVSDGEAKSEKTWNDYIAPNWDGTKYRLYDTNTDFSGGASYDLSASNLQDQIDAGYGFIHMATHGNQQIWGMESGYSYSSNDALAQSNTKMGLVVTMACITNAFDCDPDASSSNSNGGPYHLDPCLSEGFLRNANGGAVGYLGSSRYGWGNGATEDPGVSLQYNNIFFEKLFTGNGQTAETEKRFGAVSALTKIDYIASSSSNGAYRWIMYTLNTMGDPALKIVTDNLAGTCSITSPTEGEVITTGETVTIEVTASDPSKSVSLVEFFIDDAKIGEDNSSPYNYSWNTTGYSIGSHIIKAISTDDESNSVSSMINVTIDNHMIDIFVDDFETDKGWTLTGEFERTAPQGLGGNKGNADPSSAYEGSNILGTDLTSNGDYEANLTDRAYTAVSPTIDCSGFTDIRLSFQRWLNVEQPQYDHAYIDFFNGSTWEEIYSNDATIEDNSWSLQNIELPTSANNNANVKIRFCIGSSDGGWEYSGWNIDNFVISAVNPSSISENGNLPNATALYQNYPNPFNPITSIKFFNKISGNVKLTVYNVKGELVKTLVNGQLDNTGFQTVNFDAAGLNSGVYYYKLQTSEKTLTKKMLLVK